MLVNVFTKVPEHIEEVFRELQSKLLENGMGQISFIWEKKGENEGWTAFEGQLDYQLQNRFSNKLVYDQLEKMLKIKDPNIVIKKIK